MPDQPSVPIRAQGRHDGVEDRILSEELLLEAVDHVALELMRARPLPFSFNIPVAPTPPASGE